MWEGVSESQATEGSEGQHSLDKAWHNQIFILDRSLLQCEGGEIGGQEPGRQISELRQKLDPWRADDGCSQRCPRGQLDRTCS